MNHQAAFRSYSSCDNRLTRGDCWGGGSGFGIEVEAVKVHYLGPCRYKVFDELFLSVFSGINFGDRSQLRVRTEYQIDTRSGPLQFTRLGVTTFEEVVADL